MGKSEISSTLKNLKFMQRAAQREEKAKVVEEEIIPNGNFSPSAIVKKCVVIMEADPHPGLSRGRMSFQSFNPAIDKLNEEANAPSEPEASMMRSDNQNEKIPVREDDSTQDNFELNRSSNSTSGDLKRKQPEVASETLTPNKSKKHSQVGQDAHRGGRNKLSKGRKLDWNVLRAPKRSKEDQMSIVR